MERVGPRNSSNLFSARRKVSKLFSRSSRGRTDCSRLPGVDEFPYSCEMMIVVFGDKIQMVHKPLTGVFLCRPLSLRFPDQDCVRTATKNLFKPGRSAAQTCAQIRKQFDGKRKTQTGVRTRAPDSWIPPIRRNNFSRPPITKYHFFLVQWRRV